jgi:hypothetical protein
MNKTEIIKNGEVGLSTTLSAGGYKYRALYQPATSGLVSRAFPFNPSFYLWQELIEDEGVPFLKVAVARNRVSAEDVLRLAGSRNPVLAEMIIEHQASLALPPLRVGIGNNVFARFIKLDHWLHRRGFRVLARINFAICAFLYKLWLLKRHWYG